MGTALRPIGHDDRLSLVDHLDELRTRLIICVCTFVVCFGICFWQNDRILDLLNDPLTKASTSAQSASGDPLEQASLWQQQLKTLLGDIRAYGAAAAETGDPGLRDLAERLERSAAAAEASTPRATPRRPVTLGVGGPFFTTMKVAGYGALLLALPVLLWQVYAFLLPAFSPTERRVAMPLMIMVPFLFAAGVAFAYFLVLPNAVQFLQNFNDDNFDILLQARDFYRFSLLVLTAMGLLFQIPVLILGVTRVGIVSVEQLRRNRRYAILVIAVLAMLLPGQDPVTLGLAMAPLLVLYEGSILMVALLDRRAARAHAKEAAEMTAANDAELEPLDPDHPSDSD
jgi:sec-independent protein translocase protein TatC